MSSPMFPFSLADLWQSKDLYKIVEEWIPGVGNLHISAVTVVKGNELVYVHPHGHGTFKAKDSLSGRGSAIVIRMWDELTLAEFDFTIRFHKGNVYYGVVRIDDPSNPHKPEDFTELWRE